MKRLRNYYQLHHRAPAGGRHQLLCIVLKHVPIHVQIWHHLLERAHCNVKLTQTSCVCHPISEKQPSDRECGLNDVQHAAAIHDVRAAVGLLQMNRRSVIPCTVFVSSSGFPGLKMWKKFLRLPSGSVAGGRIVHAN